MKLAKTVSLDLEDLIEIDERIKKGEISSLSEFIQESVKNRLKILGGE